MQRSPTMLRICQAASHHFAKNGYHGASLNEIAAKVGIRKASLYAHFKSKDELFMMVFADALLAEKDFVANCFLSSPIEEQAGYRYCWQMEERYQDAISLHLLLQTAYLPPKHLRHHIDLGYRNYLTQLQSLFSQQLRQQKAYSELDELHIEKLSQAYLGIIDSLYVELVYTNELSDMGESFHQRRDALWWLLQQTLAQVSS